jgi:hypothetical protein
VLRAVNACKRANDASYELELPALVHFVQLRATDGLCEDSSVVAGSKLCSLALDKMQHLFVKATSGIVKCT